MTGPLDRADRPPADRPRTWLGALGGLAVLAALWSTGGAVGAAAGVGVAAAWYVGGDVFAFAGGAASLAALGALNAPGPTASFPAGVGALGLLALLLGSVRRSDEAARTTVAFAAALTVLLASVWLVTRAADALWPAALALAALVATGVVALHRYEVATRAPEDGTP